MARIIYIENIYVTMNIKWNNVLPVVVCVVFFVDCVVELNTEELVFSSFLVEGSVELVAFVAIEC